jgi:histidine triad (HIT) family protein
MCIFCKIVAGEIPNDTVLEDKNFLAFNDIEPQAKRHILVIPKKHFNSFEDIDSDTMAKMTEFIKEVSKKAQINESGYRLITNIGSDGGQEVEHLHFHLLGKEKMGKLVCL